jgi:hypothetical protein
MRSAYCLPVITGHFYICSILALFLTLVSTGIGITFFHKTDL